MDGRPEKPLFFMGSSQDDLREFPEDAKDEVGYALYRVQLWLTPRSAKPLKGYGGATVVEISEDYQTDTYRAVYTVRFAGVVYVLHVFQKKSRRGHETPQADLKLIRRRLAQAEEHYRGWLQKQEQRG